MNPYGKLGRISPNLISLKMEGKELSALTEALTQSVGGPGEGPEPLQQILDAVDPTQAEAEALRSNEGVPNPFPEGTEHHARVERLRDARKRKRDRKLARERELKKKTETQSRLTAHTSTKRPKPSEDDGEKKKKKADILDVIDETLRENASDQDGENEKETDVIMEKELVQVDGPCDWAEEMELEELAMREKERVKGLGYGGE